MKNNPVGWFEIYVSDIQRAKKFYEHVLQVKLEKMTHTDEIQMYGFPGNMDSAGATGAICQMKDCVPGGFGTMVYFSCEDCSVEEKRITAAGGRIQKPKMSIAPYGFITIAIDTEGNVFGLHSMK